MAKIIQACTEAHLFYKDSNPGNLLKGADMRMAQDPRYFCCIYATHLFRDDVPDMRARVETVAHAILHPPHSRVRCVQKEGRFCYDTSVTQDLLPRMVREVAEEVHAQPEEIMRIFADSKIPMVVLHSKRKLSFACHHLFFDGMAAARLMQRFFDEHEDIPHNRFNYVPVRSELRWLPSLRHFGTLTRRRGLTYSPRYQDGNPTSFYSKYDIQVLHRFKKSCNPAVSFIACIGAKVVMDVFASSPHDVDMLVVGIPYAFASPVRFNNYGVVIFKVNRPKAHTTYRQFTKHIHDMVQLRRGAFGASYLYNNVYCVESADDAAFQAPDILLSGGWIHRKKPLTMNNVPVDEIHPHNDSHTSPVNCSFLSCRDSVHMTWSLRCPEIRADRLKELATSMEGNEIA
jgi:hypothetical protein